MQLRAASAFAMGSHDCGCMGRLVQARSGTPVRKVWRLDSPEKFDLAVMQLATALRERTQGPEERALDAALRVLDVDWHASTAAQRRELLSRAMRAAKHHLAAIPSGLAPTLTEAAQSVTRAVRSDGLEAGLAIGSSFSAFDERVTRFLTRSETLFVTDAYGRRVDAFGTRAREVVARALEFGYGRDDIAEALQLAAESTLVSRDRGYWEVVGGAFVGRGRSYAQVGSYREAGISRYQIVAVMDERTSAVCRAMHGKVLPVAAALRRFEDAEKLERPEDIKRLDPWPSGSGPLSDSLTAQLVFPPFHGLCRTATVAVL